MHQYLAESIPAEAAERISLLAIAWDRKVQVAKLFKSELKVYGKWSLDSAAIGVAWLDDQVVILCLFVCLSHMHLNYSSFEWSMTLLLHSIFMSTAFCLLIAKNLCG